MIRGPVRGSAVCEHQFEAKQRLLTHEGPGGLRYLYGGLCEVECSQVLLRLPVVILEEAEHGTWADDRKALDPSELRDPLTCVKPAFVKRFILVSWSRPVNDPPK